MQSNTVVCNSHSSDTHLNKSLPGGAVLRDAYSSLIFHRKIKPTNVGMVSKAGAATLRARALFQKDRATQKYVSMYCWSFMYIYLFDLVWSFCGAPNFYLFVPSAINLLIGSVTSETLSLFKVKNRLDETKAGSKVTCQDEQSCLPLHPGEMIVCTTLVLLCCQCSNRQWFNHLCILGPKMPKQVTMALWETESNGRGALDETQCLERCRLDSVRSGVISCIFMGLWSRISEAVTFDVWAQILAVHQRPRRASFEAWVLHGKQNRFSFGPKEIFILWT